MFPLPLGLIRFSFLSMIMFTEMKIAEMLKMLKLLLRVPSSFLRVISTLLWALFSNLSESAYFDGSANYCRGSFFFISGRNETIVSSVCLRVCCGQTAKKWYQPSD